MAKKNSAETEDDALSFEQCLVELETIVGELESGKLGLAEALVRYEQGVKHLKSCHQLLERAERRIELLSGVDAEGNPVTQPYDDQEHESLEEKAATRGRRRGAAQQDSPCARDMDDPGQLF